MEIQKPKVLKLVYQFYRCSQRSQSVESDKHILFDLGDGSQFIKTSTQMFYFHCSDVWTPTFHDHADPKDDIVITEHEYHSMFRNAYIAGFIEAAVNTLKKEVIICGRGGHKVTLRPIAQRPRRPKQSPIGSPSLHPPVASIPAPIEVSLALKPPKPARSLRSEHHLNDHHPHSQRAMRRSKTPEPVHVHKAAKNGDGVYGRRSNPNLRAHQGSRARLLSYRARNGSSPLTPHRATKQLAGKQTKHLTIPSHRGTVNVVNTASPNSLSMAYPRSIRRSKSAERGPRMLYAMV